VVIKRKLRKGLRGIDMNIIKERIMGNKNLKQLKAENKVLEAEKIKREILKAEKIKNEELKKAKFDDSFIGKVVNKIKANKIKQEKIKKSPINNNKSIFEIDDDKGIFETKNIFK
jgi:hypothetical protein